MFLRKTRTHFMGASNRSSDRFSQTQQNFSSTQTNFSLRKSTNKQPIEVKNPFTSCLKKRSQKERTFNGTRTQKLKQTEMSQWEGAAKVIEKRLRRMHKNNKDIVKLLKCWGFNEKGYITEQEFQRQVERRVGQGVEK